MLAYENDDDDLRKIVDEREVEGWYAYRGELKKNTQLHEHETVDSEYVVDTGAGLDDVEHSTLLSSKSSQQEPKR